MLTARCDTAQEEMSAADKQYNQANERIDDLQKQLEVCCAIATRKAPYLASF